MRFPREWSHMHETLAHHLPHLRPAQRRGLALWVYGTMLAQSACQNAVITALLTVGAWHGLRARLRDWLYDGPDKAAPCQTQLDVTTCFAPLLRWLLAWWQGRDRLVHSSIMSFQPAWLDSCSCRGGGRPPLASIWPSSLCRAASRSMGSSWC
jgi:hypothetical protein